MASHDTMTLILDHESPLILLIF